MGKAAPFCPGHSWGRDLAVSHQQAVPKQLRTESLVPKDRVWVYHRIYYTAIPIHGNRSSEIDLSKATILI